MKVILIIYKNKEIKTRSIFLFNSYSFLKPGILLQVFFILLYMNYFNQLYITVFSRFKGRFKQKANIVALYYISVVEIALLLLIGVFFIKFLDQMKVVVMSGANAGLLFIMTAVFIHFKNWVSYTGRKRLVLNAKLSSKKVLEYSSFLLIVLPIGIIGLSLLMLKAL